MLSTQQNLSVNQLLGPWHRWIRSLRTWLPGECLVCTQPVKTTQDLCTHCFSQLAYNRYCCTRCAEPLLSQRKDLLCRSCQETPPAFDQVLAPYLYAPPLDALLLNFKKNAKRTAGSLLLDLLMAELKTHPALQQAEALVAIPGQKDRLRQRGIDPPAWLAQRLAWQLKQPFLTQGLKRCRNITSQQELSRKKRWLNPQGAFVASQEVKGKKLLLVDDVVTTGATCHWAARELKEKGAASVTVIAAARTPF
ncbi:comF family protein [Marinospirillum celere]|uniref:ComF family protein n=1 Tax=Marinospirillum celere TaxID=1122252 RepID=A0A1I1E4P0_9GAMM|nr:double zinc ribbon domain-containing protein [Marinospirillum celere]SFB79833.1 comF family protein [Marinospirillum celere]